MRTLLFQLRALVNAGFRAVMVLSGQNGAQGDLRLVADEFTRIVPRRSRAGMHGAGHPPRQV